ncbi:MULTISPECIES: FAD-binding oxidoreductase [unclassified Curtobacterium]|uniref:NAD(P)/FAD-dependent oxidoreductase n=1 Tax=unclassified Curtobacterium TaxID=257496 RepID=UPI000FA5CEF4|nr:MULTISPECIES: FAD-dependent oxidoreductase [unclassified Curtobacterium]ROS36811.1 glycine/D-amino acid oxidase-like deaminating enzyme [Curtobacterium sp. PhB131]
MSGYRGVSFWLDQLASTGRDDLAPRPPLDGDTTADVAIVGGGLTGLWTAWYLHQADPGLQIVVLEREIAGFGASGRNGGWCSALFPRSAESVAREHGRDAALALRAAMRDTVDEVGRAASEAGVDCDYVKGGTVLYARSAVQERSAHDEVASAAEWGDAMTWRPARSGDAAGSAGVAWTPDCARVQPAALVRGLAAALEARGVRIAEHTPASSWDHGHVVTSRGTVTAGAVVIAVEGYGAQLEQTKRRILPLYSLMIATAPLPAAVWDRIGLEHGQTFSDYRHLLVYGQRTADDRLAFGGRGARYHWGPRSPPATTGYHACSSTYGVPWWSCSPPSPTPRSPTRGAARSGCRATGARPSPGTGTSAPPAATSVTDSPRRTWPGGRSPTSCAGSRRRSPRCRG